MRRGSTPDFLALLRVPGLGPVRARRLLQRCGDAAGIFAAGPVLWAETGCGEALCAALAQPDRAGAETDLAWLAAAPNRHFIAHGDPLYPSRLAQIARPPLALFAIGDLDLLSLPQMALVGARSASAQGRANARRFATELAQRGLTVTSGLALGIDTAAHEGALDANGSTLAVCGNGLDRVYPARNAELATRIVERGLLISEFPIGIAPRPEHFPQRNRIISGLSLGVLVVEAQLQSGSLITARLAAEQGREVFAIPGSIHNPLARGCHALIREGAKLTETVDDILAELAPLLPATPPAGPAGPLPAAPRPTIENPLQQRVLVALGEEAIALDALVDLLEVPVAELSAALLALELLGHVEANAGDRFSRLRR